MSSTFENTFAVIVTLASGAFSSISNKISYQTSAIGSNGVSKKFTKAYIFTVGMFLGEMLCLFWYYFTQWRQKKSAQADHSVNGSRDSLLGGSSSSSSSGSYSAIPSVVSAPASPFAVSTQASDKESLLNKSLPKPPVYYYLILSCFDLTATTVNNVGQLYVSASANQMLRGSSVLFTGVSSFFILRKKLSKGQWFGIFWVIVALVMVGASASLRQKYEPDSSDTNNATASQVFGGILLILLGSLLNSIQNVFEEKLLKGGQFADVDPLEVVGWEGVFGTILSTFIMLPICAHVPGDDNGVQEDSLDTLKMFSNSSELVGLFVGYCIALGVMNNYSQLLSKNLSAVHRMLVSTCRVVLVWAIQLIIYSFSTSLGERWDRFSWLQLGGFIVLVAGTMIYVKARNEPAHQEESSEQV